MIPVGFAPITTRPAGVPSQEKRCPSVGLGIGNPSMNVLKNRRASSLPCLDYVWDKEPGGLLVSADYWCQGLLVSVLFLTEDYWCQCIFNEQSTDTNNHAQALSCGTWRKPRGMEALVRWPPS